MLNFSIKNIPTKIILNETTRIAGKSIIDLSNFFITNFPCINQGNLYQCNIALFSSGINFDTQFFIINNSNNISVDNKNLILDIDDNTFFEQEISIKIVNNEKNKIFPQ